MENTTLTLTCLLLSLCFLVRMLFQETCVILKLYVAAIFCFQLANGHKPGLFKVCYICQIYLDFLILV